MAHYGTVLAAWRKARGWSQAEAAKRIGVAQGVWAPWETGAKTPDLQNALEIDRLTKGEVSVSGWRRRRRQRKQAA